MTQTNNRPDDDLIDGCEFSDQDEYISDDDIDGIVLFADIAGSDLDAIAKRKAEWEELFADGERHQHSE